MSGPSFRSVLSFCLGVFLTTASAQEALQSRQWEVDGVTRHALLHLPVATASSGQPSPVIFAWHGHGGTAQNAARSFHLHTLWPEAIVVYGQGLNTPGRLTDPEGKRPGWQSGIGVLGDRDLKFFDAMLASLKKDRRIDERRIYSTGHSNGGSFTFLLWAARGDVFAATAPSASVAGANVRQLKPKPVLHISGERDELVKYSWQQANMAALQRLNQCAPKSQPWELDSNCSFYPSAIACPVVTAIHPGGHGYPAEAPEVIVKFFKAYPKPVP